MSSFKGMIFGVEYTDRAEFEKAARDAGWRSGMSNRTGDWKVSLPVHFTTDAGERLAGQVWAKGSDKGTVVLALEDGHYARVRTDSGSGGLVDGQGNRLAVSGRVG